MWGDRMSIVTIQKYLTELDQAVRQTDMDAIHKAVEVLWEAYENNRQVFIFGNGGSASTASHMACDIGKGVVREGKKRFRVQSLCDNVAVMTAWANDVSYETMFKDQLENLLNEKDVVIAISASGNSPNVVKAVEFGKKQGATIIGLSGFSGGILKDMSDISIHFPVKDYGQVEDLHLMCEHIITQCIRERMRHV